MEYTINPHKIRMWIVVLRVAGEQGKVPALQEYYVMSESE